MSTPQPRARIRQKKHHDHLQLNISPTISDGIGAHQQPDNKKLFSFTECIRCLKMKPQSSHSQTDGINIPCNNSREIFYKASRRSLSTIGFQVDPLKRRSQILNTPCIMTKNTEKQEVQIAINLMKYSLNKLGSSMPNLYKSVSFYFV